ncbi:MAG: serine/threonine-protein kinase [Planctomycetaceae bacterium]
MTDDKKASVLISKSLRYKLDGEEKSEVEQNLESSVEARKFAKLSRLIQDSVRIGVEDNPDLAPGLSGDAKDRLRSSVSEAIRSSAITGISTANNAEAGTQIERTLIGSAEPSLDSTSDHRVVKSRFNIVRKLGEGGLGTVWLARDNRLKRNVAIKEMRLSALESPAAWNRFRREAEITGHLEHPAIVPLYLFGVNEASQQPFYAMRFVGKRMLSDAIVELHERSDSCKVQSHLRLHRLLGNFLRVCEAIAFAHSRGVIHRDLKPENIAIDNFGQVIVLDWGLAKVLDTAELGTQMLLEEPGFDEAALAQTMAGEVVGTPLYMSPEQAAGDLDSIDERTDIYGLGAILFSILTGHAPHEKTAETTESDARVAAVLQAIAEGTTPRPTDYAPCIPRTLEKICMRAMAGKRFMRFESAMDLANAVEAWMAGQTNRAAEYENLRMEGRELKNDFQACVDDLESNVRFASLLPPIQELISPETNENESVWRERLTTIFTGLLRAKPMFSRIVFSKVEGDEFTELVRTERHTRDRATVRKVPRSRLRTGKVNSFIERTLEQQPEEVYSSLVCNPMCEKSPASTETHLVVGLPIYDEQTEEPFGVIMIDCDIEAIFERQLRRRSVAAEMIVACDTFHTLTHAVDGNTVPESFAKPVKDVQPDFLGAIDELQTSSEYLDDTNQTTYGARLWLQEKRHGIMYLLRLADQ